MGKLITVVGNSGVGKTTLVLKLAEVGSFTPILEVTDERPFLQRFKDNLKGYCLANQIDFLLYQAERQLFVRENDNVGVQDGGIDFTFHVFTTRFHQKGYLDEDEFRLCERLYLALNKFLPPPDLMIMLTAPHEVIAERMKKRGREIDIERSQDLVDLDRLMQNWLATISSTPVIQVDAGKDDPSYSSVIDDLLVETKRHLGI